MEKRAILKTKLTTILKMRVLLKQEPGADNHTQNNSFSNNSGLCGIMLQMPVKSDLLSHDSKNWMLERFSFKLLQFGFE